MPVTTAEAFLRVITKSGLLSAEQVEATRQEFADENEPKAIARKLIKDGAINKWQALQLLAGRSALMLGKYKLLDQIDADDVRRTYLAEHAQMGRRVAVTSLSSKYTNDNPKAVKHFLNQARKLAALDHRNIVHTYDVDSHGDRYYVVMEYIDSGNLQEILDDRGALPLELVTRYVSQCAAGLAYAHEKKHVHGAICPANLLIDAQDDVKIANLGMTATVVSKKGDTPTAAVDYISPEQAAGESNPDARSDLYSLGCVMYALLTGHPPFTEGSDDERRQMHQTGQPPSVLDERPDASEELVAICEKTMAKKPSDRFKTAGEICEQLERGPGEESEAEPVAVSAEPDDSDSSDDAESKPVPPKAASAPPRPKAKKKPPSDSKAADAAAPKAGQAKPKPKAEQPAKSPPAKKTAGERREPSAKQPSADKSKPAPKQDKPSPKQEVAADVPAKASAPAAKGKKPGKPSEKKAGEKAKAGATAAAAGGIGVDTKRRRKRKKGSAAQGGIPTKAYIIGGAVGGLVLLAGVILLAVVLFSGGDGEEVAVADGEAATAENAEGAEGAESNVAAEDDPAIDAEMDPEVDPVFEEESDPVAESDDTEASDSGTEDSDTEPTEESAAKSDGSDDAMAKPAEAPKPAAGAEKTETAAKAKADAKDASDSASKQKPEEKPDEKPAAKTPEKKAAAKKAPAKKPPAKPTKKPFQDLQKLVSLPDVNAAEPKAIGFIHVPSGELCFIKLRGGDNAFKGNQIFAMRNADGGLAERDWEVFLRDGESGPDTKIAHLSLDDKSKLNFQWQPEAAALEPASYLTNCAFSLSCSGESHVAVLRKPKKVEAMALDLEKPSTEQDWDVDMLPDPSAVIVEIAGVQGAKYKVEPTSQLDADKGEVWVQVEDGGGLLSLQVETSLKRSLQIEVTPHIKLSADAKPEKLNVRKLHQYTKTAQAAMQQRQMVLNQMNQAMKAKKMKKNQKRRTFGPRIALIESELKKAQTAFENCQKIEQMLKGVKLTMSFRVLYDADTSEVDLLQIGG